MPNTTDTEEIFAILEQVIAERLQTAAPETSYVATLNTNADAALKKIAEEACEVILAAKSFDSAQDQEKTHTQTAHILQQKEALISESADLLFHLLIVLGQRNITLESVATALKQRMGLSGLEEKRQRHQQ